MRIVVIGLFHCFLCLLQARFEVVGDKQNGIHFAPQKARSAIGDLLASVSVHLHGPSSADYPKGAQFCLKITNRLLAHSVFCAEDSILLLLSFFQMHYKPWCTTRAGKWFRLSKRWLPSPAAAFVSY